MPARSLAAIGALGVLLGACADEGPGSVASDACAPAVEPPLQDGSHLLGDAEPPVAYSSTPPTSGWHASGNPRTGVIPAEDPLTDPELVLTIEVGQAVVAYDPARVDTGTVAELEELATGTYDQQLTVTPYEGAEAPLSLVAWGVLQSCDELDPDVLDAFVTAHADPHADAH
ncbi:MAG: DUF3105 domain-containing protein [Actinobacteria bacterium]|nr:DUF3105 domain-containing protein [Actinomycetota bacterium]